MLRFSDIFKLCCVKKLRFICLFAEKVLILQPNFKNKGFKNKEKETMKSLNLISNIIIIRLRGVVGSDEACIRI